MITPEVWEAIKPIFARHYPCEAVVAVLRDGSWRELENVAKDTRYAFELREEDHLDLVAEPPLALIHSHCNGLAIPSDLDTRSQLATGWTWGIVAVHGDSQGNVFHVAYPEFWGDEVPIAPLLGRTYLWGIRDCYTLVRDYYRLEGHQLANLPRVLEPNRYPVGSPQRAQFKHGIAALGIFDPIPRAERRRGDAFTFVDNLGQPAHCGVFMGMGRYLHQARDRTSCEEEFKLEEKLLERMCSVFYRPRFK
jgi:proteasome lid subunit RPN8/RPN11